MKYCKTNFKKKVSEAVIKNLIDILQKKAFDINFIFAI